MDKQLKVTICVPRDFHSQAFHLCSPAHEVHPNPPLQLHATPKIKIKNPKQLTQQQKLCENEGFVDYSVKTLGWVGSAGCEQIAGSTLRGVRGTELRDESLSVT